MSAEVGDIFRALGNAYRQQRRLPPHQLRAMQAIGRCRTAALGGHRDRCDHCGALSISYNSCRNRHCPKCQGSKTTQWIQSRQADILPVPYYHLVFTVPEELNPLLLRNQRVGYGLLFRAMSETLRELCRDPKYLGAEVGIIALLHTWGQNLLHHPHLHCLVTGGGLAAGGNRWRPTRKNFFLPVKVVSRLFRGKFMALLQRAFAEGKLIFPGQVRDLQAPERFNAWCRAPREREWVVFCKPPFRQPATVLEYLGRYTHRVAITNRRIIGFADGQVVFRWKDYRDRSRWKTMTVSGFEFIRRFLLHILPPSFVKVRYYGLYGHRGRQAKLARSRKLLHATEPTSGEPPDGQPSPLPPDYRRCPVCGQGRMLVFEILTPQTLQPPGVRCAA